MGDDTAVRSDLVDLDVFVLRETDKAWGIGDPNKTGNIIWLPKSQCEVDEIKMPSKSATLTCPEGAGCRHADIASFYGVSRSAIGKVARRERWSEVA